MSKTIRIATLGVAHDYSESLIPRIIEALGFRINWAGINNADLVVLGPFYKPKKHRWLPRPMRDMAESWLRRLSTHARPVTLFQTGENLRHDHIACDYALSFDLEVNSKKHLRLPYWFEMVNWEHEGIYGNRNPRFGTLLQLNRLHQPLGEKYLEKHRKAAIFASHLSEPRTTLIQAVEKFVPVQGFGPAFDSSVKNHSSSDFCKLEVLKNFAFNLCPENSMYPGYYTEKIPEAFMADCLPLTWTDSNVAVDFNPQAFINLAPMTAHGFRELSEELLDSARIKRYAEQPLLLKKPTLEPVTELLRHITAEATS